MSVAVSTLLQCSYQINQVDHEYFVCVVCLETYIAPVCNEMEGEYGLGNTGDLVELCADDEKRAVTSLGWSNNAASNICIQMGYASGTYMYT